MSMKEKSVGTHESLSRQHDVKMGSDKSFGLVFAGFFSIIGLWPLLGGEGARLWALAVAAGFCGAAFIKPALLKPLNGLWFKFGLLLHKVVSPVILSLLYLVAIVPAGLVMKALGKDPLRLKMDKSADTYWIARDPPGPAAESFKQQF